MDFTVKEDGNMFVYGDGEKLQGDLLPYVEIGNTYGNEPAPVDKCGVVWVEESVYNNIEYGNGDDYGDMWRSSKNKIYIPLSDLIHAYNKVHGTNLETE